MTNSLRPALILLVPAAVAASIAVAPAAGAATTNPVTTITSTTEGLISTVNDNVLYSAPLAPTTTAVETAIITSPLGAVQDGVNATYAGLKSLLTR